MTTENEITMYSLDIPKDKAIPGFYRMKSGLMKGSIWLFLNDIDALHISGSAVHEFGHQCHFKSFNCHMIEMWEKLEISHIKML